MSELTVTELCAVCAMLLAERVKILEAGPIGGRPLDVEDWGRATFEWLKPLGEPDASRICAMLVTLLDAGADVETHRAACEAHAALRTAAPNGQPIIEYTDRNGAVMAPEDPAALRDVLYPWLRFRLGAEPEPPEDDDPPEDVDQEVRRAD